LKIIVARSKQGKLEEVSIAEGELKTKVREVVEEALRLWDMETSDFIVMRDRYTMQVKLPLTKEQYEEYSKYDLRRLSGSEAEVRIPIYVISFNNEWRGEDYVDKEVYVVAPYVNEEQAEDIKELASNATAEMTGEED